MRFRNRIVFISKMIYNCLWNLDQNSKEITCFITLRGDAIFNVKLFGINFRILHLTCYLTLTWDAIFNVKVKLRAEPDNFFQFDHIGMIQLLQRLHLNCQNKLWAMTSENCTDKQNYSQVSSQWCWCYDEHQMAKRWWFDWRTNHVSTNKIYQRPLISGMQLNNKCHLSSLTLRSTTSLTMNLVVVMPIKS